MKRKIMMVAVAAFVCGAMTAQQGKVPNEGEKVTFQKTIEPTNQSFFLKAPTTLWEDHADVTWYNSTATEFTLTTAAQVAGLAKIVNSGNDFAGITVILGNDIDFGDHLWMPIGKGYLFPFSGIFKGNDKKISNIYINLPGGDFVGFIGQMFKGKIENLRADHVVISSRDTTGSIVGNLSTQSTMDNCHATNVNISVTGYNAGGLVGGLLTDSHITNSSAEGEVSGVNQIGGFVGTVWDNTSITNSYAKGSVSGEYIVGGFAGYSTMAFAPGRNNTITDSYTRANVTASSERVGGFYGGPEHNAITKNVYSTGTVSEVFAHGGFGGFVAMTTVQNVYYDNTNAPMDAFGMEMGPPQNYDIYPLSTTEMQTQTLATKLNANRPETVWFYDPTINDGYPTLNFEQSLSTSNTAVTSKIGVYPTAVIDYLHINSAVKNISYKVVDFSGRVIKSGNTVDGKVNLTQLQKGNYMILLQAGSQTSSHKFIKK